MIERMAFSTSGPPAGEKESSASVAPVRTFTAQRAAGAHASWQAATRDVIDVVGETAPVAWQARALDRSLGEARAKSVERLSLFVGAARELAACTGSSSFTVAQVVERSGQSLKSFYRHFEGKDDLLLALLEEDSSVGASILAELIDAHRSPKQRARAWVFGLFELMAAGEEGYVGVLIREHRRLTEARPEQTEAALKPFIDLLAAELDAAMAAGTMRRGDAHRDAETVFDLVLLKIHELVLRRGDLAPDAMAAYVWGFCWSGLRTGRA